MLFTVPNFTFNLSFSNCNCYTKTSELSADIFACLRRILLFVSVNNVHTLMYRTLILVFLLLVRTEQYMLIQNKERKRNYTKEKMLGFY